MICNECGRTLKSVNNRHLNQCCGLTPSQYRAKYPGCSLVDDDVRKSYGSVGEQNCKWRGGISKPNCEGCGVPVTRKSHIRYCRKCSIAVKGNPFQGKLHSEATRQRMVESAGRRDPSTYHKIVNDPAELSQRAKLRWQNATSEERAVHLKNFIEAGQHANKRSKDTKIEAVVASLLSRLGVAYEHTYKIGQYYVDYTVGRKVIECYGDYWHCNPRQYADTTYNKSLHMTCLEKRLADLKRVEIIEASEYEVLCLWETDILLHPERCYSQIALFLRSSDGQV